MMEALTRSWDGEPREQAFCWQLRKGRRSARCALWSHPIRWELRVTVDGELIRSQAYRVAGDVLRDLEARRAHAQQSPTLRDQVRANEGKPVSILVRRDAGAVPLETLAKVDLVVRGKLINPKSYLSEDGHHVYTDYELVPNRMISDRSGIFNQVKPGIPPRITVTLYGGELIIDRTRVSVTDGTRGSWSEGADLLLFLIRKSSDGGVTRFEVGAPGIFEVRGDHVKALRLRGDRDPEIEGVPFEQLVQTIAAHAKQ